MVNRIIKSDRVIDINLEQKASAIVEHPISNDQGDVMMIEKTNKQHLSSMDLLNKQFNAYDNGEHR